jgi:hypothetical protein
MMPLYPRPSALILSLGLALPLGTSACKPKVLDVDTGHVGDDTGDTPLDTEDSTLPSAAFTELSWRLHERYPSLVWVSWTQDVAAEVHVEFRVSGDESWRSSPVIETPAGSVERLIAGIPYGVEADWRLVDDSELATDGPPIVTGPLPSGLPVAERMVARPDAWLESGNYLLCSINEQAGGWTGGTYWTFIVDRLGRPVWAQAAPDGNWTLFAQVALSGDHILWDEATYWSRWDDGADSSVHRSWLDAEIEQISTPGLHHAFVQLPDEVLVWGSQDHGGGEALVQRGPADLDETILWTCSEDWPGAGRCESNGLFWNPVTDTFLYSFYTNNSLVEVDHATGASLWWAGMVRGGYTFDPSNSQFYWQHGVSWTNAGALLVSTQTENGRGTTDVMEYEVDHDAHVLREIWTYRSGERADTNGDAWRLENGNTLHVIGSSGVLKEVDPAGEEVWTLDFKAEKLLGRGEFIEDLFPLLSPDAWH